jgi:two-component system response regulator RegX3
MSQEIRVLVVEDERSIREGLTDVLTYHGYRVEAVDSGEAGLDAILCDSFQLVLLDVMLPGLNGFDVCRQAREMGSKVAILMLTAKGSEDDVVEGLRVGADDYVTKPFSIRELTARVDALVRRTSSRQSESVVFGGWTVDPATLTATCDGDGGATCELTPRELELVALFVRERGRIVSRRMLLKEVWHMSKADEVETRTVDMHIAKLRKKLDPDTALITTIRGAGYRYVG